VSIFRWDGGDPGLVNQKTPTTLLLDPGGKFHSFGYAARDSYHDLDTQEAKRWLYFDKFKMVLHHNVVSARFDFYHRRPPVGYLTLYTVRQKSNPEDFFAVFSVVAWNFKAKFYRHM